LLRDIRDVAAGTLSTRITSQLQSLQGLHLRLRDIGAYLQKVLDGELPVNHSILGNLQDVFNLLPNLGSAVKGSEGYADEQHSELARAMSVKTNDQLMAIYLSSLIRAITAFHDLIENKIQNRQQQEEKDGDPKEGVKKDDEKTNAEKKDGSDDKDKVNGVNGKADGEKKSDKKKGS
jgi:26S proteasome regulatory subunit N8